MRVELNYESNIFGECPTDYDITKINDENELKFLKWMTILQSTTTRLRYNIELFDYYFILYLCNDVIKNKFKCYFTLLLSNISTALSVDFSCLFSNENDLNIDNFKSFCYKYPKIFKNEPISESLTKTKIATKKAKEKYKEFFEIARNKIFAHSDDILLDDRNTENIDLTPGEKFSDRILFYLATGARPNEIKCVDKIKDGAIHIAGTKTKLANRWVVVSKAISDRYAEKEASFWHFDEKNFREYFQIFLKKIGVRGDGTVYMLRHTFATNLFILGVPDKIRQVFMGHSSTKLTNDIYTSYDPTVTADDIRSLYGDFYPVF